jgi:ribose transport system substrate-binding protein
MIPVATIGGKVTAGEILVHLQTYYPDVGSVAGKYLNYKLGGNGNVALLEGTPGNAAFSGMKAGFVEVIKASHIKILEEATAESPDRAYDRMRSLLMRYPNLQGVFIEGDYMIPGVVHALREAGVMSRVVTIGYGATPEALGYIKEGGLNATVEDFPCEQARVALRFLVQYIKDKTMPPWKECYIPSVVITNDKCPNCYPPSSIIPIPSLRPLPPK